MTSLTRNTLLCVQLTALAFLMPAVSARAEEAPDAEPLHATIDRLVDERTDVPAAEPTSDSAFLRRLTLDFAGRIPTVDQVRSFLADDGADKRTRKVDELLASPRFAARMHDVFHVMLMERMGDNDEWSRFLKTSFAANKPWDRMAAEILRPDPDNEQTRGSAFFWTKRLEKYGQNPTDYPGLARDIGRLFLGVDLQCAQCHDHLFVDDYKQRDFQGLFAFVQHTSIRTDVKFPAVAEKLVTEKLEFASVFTQEQESTGPRLPKSDEVMIPKLEKGDEYIRSPDRKTRFPGIPRFSPLTELSARLASADNTDFRRNAVNRIWFVMFGRGLVDPLDLSHADNPPSHPELLDLLADDFAAHDFDIRRLLREIALTKTWQRSSRLPGTGHPQVPPESFAMALERPLSAEQLLRSLLIVTGHEELVTALDTDDDSEQVDDEKRKQAQELLETFRTAFANPPRDPEIDFRPGVKAALYLMNDESLQPLFIHESSRAIVRLVSLNDDQLPDEIYLTALSREPTSDEAATIREVLSQHAGDRARAIGNILWALTSSAEFCLNH